MALEDKPRVDLADALIYLWVGFCLGMGLFSDLSIGKGLAIFFGGIFLIFIIEGIVFAFLTHKHDG